MPLSASTVQTTLRSAIHCVGVGLHSGERATLRLRPAPINTGIVFHRQFDDGRIVQIKAHWSNAVDTPLCTVITDGEGTTIMTIEHLMAALAGCSVDNCIVELDGPEVPIMDGSSAPFVFLIDCAGVTKQLAPRKAIKILKPLKVGDERAWAMIEPDDVFSVDFEIDFANSVIGHQTGTFVQAAGSFKSDISAARTFGFMADVHKLRAAGKALGASLDNAIVIDGDKIVNEDGLRFDDEFVRHKILDAVGDLYMAGHPIVGRFTGFRSSHSLNRLLLLQLLTDPTAWSLEAVADLEATDRSWIEPARIRA